MSAAAAMRLTSSTANLARDSVTSGKGSSWRLSVPGQLPLAVIPLIALKLAGIIGWSWWWVLAPLWGSVVIFVALIGLLLLLIKSQRPKI